ncbi:hypothetical protein [Alginatibacterium sediminis]|uniref:hypothetical protein n=1 Tax=Alginatibacterium sediminis TaxID=2164068 RepID=UPI0013148637|nr:hypothetical protein [Alginatibacterium sediminis]
MAVKTALFLSVILHFLAAVIACDQTQSLRLTLYFLDSKYASMEVIQVMVF